MSRSASSPRKNVKPEGGHRAPWGTISREQVVDAATRVVRAGGYKEMSIRSLAAELGVAPMSLYRHVSDKDDLLDEVVDRLLANEWKPGAPGGDWRRWISDAAENFRRFLVIQPVALHVFLHHPVVSQAAVSRMTAMMDVLRSALNDEDAARQAYAVIHTYTLGFAALEAARADWNPAQENVDPLAAELASYTTPRQFAEGLSRLLDGIENTAQRDKRG